MDKVLDDKVRDICGHIQGLVVFHMFVRMNVESTMDRIEDRSLFDNNIGNVLVYFSGQTLFDISDYKQICALYIIPFCFKE